MRALYTNELETVPDTQAVRGYYTSIGVVFGTRCGQPNVYTQQALQAYLSEDARALQKNPLDASRHAKILGDVLRLSQDPTAITRAGLRLQEGEDDARTFLKKYDCDSTVAVRLRTNLNALVIARKNMPVEPGNNARLIAMMNPSYRTAQGIELPAAQPLSPLESTVSACQDWSKAMVKKFPMGSSMSERTAYCRCIGPKLVASSLTPAERDALIKDFGASYNELIKAKPNLMRQVMDGCTR